MDKSIMNLYGDSKQRPTDCVMGIGYELLLSTEETDGQYEIMKFVIPPGLGPPTHIHTREDECYLILDGEFEVIVGDDTFRATAGTYIHLPRNIRHGIQNCGQGFGSFLCWVIPGNLGQFFDQFRRPWPTDDVFPPPLTKEDTSRLMNASEEFGIQLLA